MLMWVRLIVGCMQTRTAATLVRTVQLSASAPAQRCAAVTSNSTLCPTCCRLTPPNCMYQRVATVLTAKVRISAVVRQIALTLVLYFLYFPMSREIRTNLPSCRGTGPQSKTKFPWPAANGRRRVGRFSRFGKAHSCHQHTHSSLTLCIMTPCARSNSSSCSESHRCHNSSVCYLVVISRHHHYPAAAAAAVCVCVCVTGAACVGCRYIDVNLISSLSPNLQLLTKLTSL